MDPKQTLMNLLDALQENDLEKAQEFAEYLIHWLNMKGFSPLEDEII